MTAGPTGQQAIQEGQPFEFSGEPLYYEDLSMAVKKGEADWVLLAQLRGPDHARGRLAHRDEQEVVQRPRPDRPGVGAGPGITGRPVMEWPRRGIVTDDAAPRPSSGLSERKAGSMKRRRLLGERGAVRGPARAGGDGARTRRPGAGVADAVARRVGRVEGTPVVTGTVPNPDDPKESKSWTRRHRSRSTSSPTARCSTTSKCKLYINGTEQELSEPPKLLPALTRATSTLQFKWDDALR